MCFGGFNDLHYINASVKIKGMTKEMENRFKMLV